MDRVGRLSPTCAGPPEEPVNVLYKTALAFRHFYVAEIGRFDGDLMRQFWETRTAIWTQKYPEPVGADGCERDAYDAVASFIVLAEGYGTVVAGTRIIHADSGTDLPVASCSQLPILGRATEVSRFFMRGDLELNAEQSEQLFKLFIFGIATFLKREGFARSYATIRSSLFERLQELGVPLVRIGPNQGHGAKTFIPTMLFDPTVRDECAKVAPPRGTETHLLQAAA